jgi:hypothetical protein
MNMPGMRSSHCWSVNSFKTASPKANEARSAAIDSALLAAAFASTAGAGVLPPSAFRKVESTLTMCMTCSPKERWAGVDL